MSQSHNELSSGRAISVSVALNANQEERGGARHAVVQAFQFDPEYDLDEEVATQRLQQYVSEWFYVRTPASVLADAVHVSSTTHACDADAGAGQYCVLTLNTEALNCVHCVNSIQD
ncbi:hypothetical protein DPX16_21677 [Anabarilius grahami]|uniref:Uncharacterized protein n=1 Tax=Anabarilius grahami TaxID=495550 RepID=A0A3N0YK13_ANAGA|nr:hypothetical protein DPX16_21677 [Anabarilius grahami]